MRGDTEGSLGDDKTSAGMARSAHHANSLGSDPTHTGGTADSTPSLGDQTTLGGELLDDKDDDKDLAHEEFEVVDLGARYRVEKSLGQGGMGAVVLATDTRLARRVAIKRILGTAAGRRAAVSRFLAEAKAVAALNHPNIVQIYDYGRAPDGPFLIMEYVDGDTLLARCQTGPIPVEQAIELTCQLCDGLAKAHAAGIVHRDIKPANVLLTEDGLAKLTDFGLAKAEAADQGMTMTGAVLGTLDYMAPEQRRDASLVDARSDLWSLAATLYQMLTGKSPKVIRLHDLPTSLQSVLSKALEDQPKDRYQTVREFKEALRGKTKGSSNQALVEDAEDLGEGVCPSCRTQNDLQRKYCKKCAGSLRVACLKCKQEIPIWDQVCGHCGGKQPELVAAERARIDAMRSEAETLAGQLSFSRSLALAQEIAAITDPRLLHQKSWAETFVPETEAEHHRQVENAAKHLSEARKHRDAFDYSAALHAIESIPAPLRTKEMQELLVTLNSNLDELRNLLKLIKNRIDDRTLDGLLQPVERALELDGSRKDLQKLRQQLLDREAKITAQCDAAFSNAERLLEQGNAKAAFAAVENVPPSRMTASRSQLRSRLQAMSTAETELSRQLAAAKSDGVVDAQEALDLLCSTIRCLRLNPRHSTVQQLQADLFKRLQALAERPLDIHLSQTDAQVLAQLPVDVLATLPLELLRQLPVSKFISIPGVDLLRLTPIQNSIGMQLKLLPAGMFTMGEGAQADRVTLTWPFFLGVYEVTQEQYQRVMGHNPANFKGPDHPVENVPWDDAVKFCRKLSALPAEKAAERVYRLPTEMEWEYACRAGTTTKFSFGDNDEQLGEYGWFNDNSRGTTHPVGQKQPNPWGFYDMHGNVYEWCQDWYGEFPKGNATNSTNELRASSCGRYRGGGWNSSSTNCRAASRNALPPTFCENFNGFRVALNCTG
ncbi:MAG: SUMF1/EgtB/PvdO family nonheme iron enzyme [Pirellulales bacterium]